MARITIFHWRDMQNPQQGGSTMNITHVAEHLAQAGHQVTFLTEKHANHKSDTEIVNGVQYIRKGKKFSQYLLLPLYSLRNLKKDTDIVIEAYDAWPFLTPLLGKKTVMLICHIQKEEWQMEFGNVIGPILRTFASILLKTVYRNSHIVTISESTTKSVVAEGIKPKSIQEIAVGIEDLMYSDSIPTKRTDRIILCTPGRLKSHKRVDIGIRLVAAYNSLETTKQKVYFDIIGAGDHENTLKALVKVLNCEEYITFHGRASDEVKRELLSKAHLHLQFSKREGWGITVIEAAAQGAPTLCFNIPGLRDSVTSDTGYIVNTQAELEEIFPKIMAEISNCSENYTNKVTSAFQFAQQFRWQTIYATWDSFIERLSKE
jgi:glycosyltransferase involved in cell wall biosynthesis